MHIQKTAALVSAVFFLTSFTVIPALTIVAHPAQSRVEETVVTELAQQALPTVSAQDVSISFRLVSLDDAELAARIVEPDHVTSEVTFSPEPSATADTPTQATTGHTPAPTLTLLAAPDLTQSEETLSRGKSASPNPAAAPLIRMPWFGEAETVYAKGDVATVMDLETGIRLSVQRTGGHNHADVETIDPVETAKLLQVAGGEWNWTRRPIIVEIDGQRIAASMTCRPHAGLDNQPALETVRNRSGDFGTGINYDSVKGNDMDGHFDIHFYKSRTHGTNSVDSQHQAAVQTAYESGL